MTIDTMVDLPLADGKVVITAASVPGTVLADFLTTCNGGQPVVIGGATRVAQANAVTVTGRTDFLQIPALATTATMTAGADGKSRTLTVRFALIGAVPGPNPWKFSRSFPSLPPLRYGDGQAAATDFLDALMLSDAAFVMTTAGTGQDPVTGAPLVAGLNFVARTRPNALLGLVGTLLAGDVTVPLYGPIILPKPAELTLPVPAVPRYKFPWQSDRMMPGIHLQADLGIDDTLAGTSLRWHELRWRIYSPHAIAWAQANRTYWPRVAVTSRLDLPSADMSLDLTAMGPFSANRLTLFGLFEGVTLAKLASLADVAGGNDLFDRLPDEIRKAGDTLGGIALQAATLRLGKGFALQGVGLTVGLPSLKATLLPGFTIEKLFASFYIDTPFGAGRSVEVSVGGRIELSGTPLDVIVDLPDISAHAVLAEKATLPLGALFKSLGLPAPPNVVVNTLDMNIGGDGSFSLSLLMADDPKWTLDLGPMPLTIGDVSLVLNRIGKTPVTAAFGGTLALGDALELEVLYQTPGEFTIRGDFPEVKLSQLMGVLTNKALALPQGFDLTFTDSSVVIENSANGLVFRLATTMDALGTVVFEARRLAVGGKTWGFAAGLDLSAAKPSAVPGFNVLSVFEKVFGLDSFVLVVSSFDDPGFTLPSLAAFNAPAIATGSTKLASLASGVIAGVNIHARWTFDTSHEQSLLRKLLGLDPTLDVTLQVGTNPSKDSRLYVGLRTKIGHMPFECQFGGQLGNGQVSLFLTGHLQATIRRRPVTFDVSMLFVANGAFLSGSMVGALDFDVVTLANLAVVIGLNWECIPSLGIAATLAVDRFQSSVAVFFDSADPSRSMVAGSVSNLTLKDVVDTFVNAVPVAAAAGAVATVADDVLPSVLDAVWPGGTATKAVGTAVDTITDDILPQVLEVLEKIALTGTSAFIIDGGLAADLDNLRFDAVAAAFGKAGVKLPAISSQLLLIVNQPGSRWHLTDMTAMLHYGLVKESTGIRVTLDTQFYLVPQTTALGALRFEQGLFLNGGLKIFSFTAFAKILVKPTRGLSVEGTMSRIVVGNESLFAIESIDGKAGPRVSVSTFTQPEQSDPSLRAPHFLIDGQTCLLGLRQGVLINVSKDGFQFVMKGGLPVPIPFTYEFDAQVLGPTDLSVGGGLHIGIGNIDLGPLGKAKIATGVAGTLDLGVKGTTLWATVTASVQFGGETLSLPRMNLDVKAASLAGLPAQVQRDLTKLLQTLLADPARWVKLVDDKLIEEVPDVGKVLRETFHQTDEQVKKLVSTTGSAVAGAASTVANTTSDVANKAGSAVSSTAKKTGSAISGGAKKLKKKIF